MPVDKQQFQLPLAVTKCRPRSRPPPDPERRERTLPERVAGIDQVLGTRDVERITGRHRAPFIAGCERPRSRANAPAADEAGCGPSSSAGCREAARTLIRTPSRPLGCSTLERYA